MFYFEKKNSSLTDPCCSPFNNSDVSRDSDVQLSLYIRIPNPSAVASMDSKSADMKEGDTSSQDVFLGDVKLEPRWEEQMQDEWFPLQGGTGKVRVQLAYKRGNVRHEILASMDRHFLRGNFTNAY